MHMKIYLKPIDIEDVLPVTFNWSHIASRVGCTTSHK